ncbi:hypothetical protein TEQG_02403 [Trichophyton equinum CBS 127.97]|uniref:Uncharacterized protein n=1 Tax=Trichophyton equinum (strain ATCC MYA-4606 / CBS 127.97) TaxID=559882 RepID=F2PNA0_TRIEC|nr:hypothetical protein TEQG_02403 [Trichophyton equinum CBS 127.97]
MRYLATYCLNIAKRGEDRKASIKHDHSLTTLSRLPSQPVFTFVDATVCLFKAVLDHLLKLHDEAITKYQSLNQGLSEEHAILEKKYTEQQLATKKLESTEKHRKKGAAERARALQADKFIHDAKEDLQHLKLQLQHVRDQREQNERRASRLIVPNKALQNKIAAWTKEIKERKHEQEIVEARLHNNAKQAQTLAGTALMQRDRERALRAGGAPQDQALDDKVLRMVTTPADLGTGKGADQATTRGQRDRNTATVDRELRILLLAEKNKVLIHAGQAAEGGSTPLIKGYRSYLCQAIELERTPADCGVDIKRAGRDQERVPARTVLAVAVAYGLASRLPYGGSDPPVVQGLVDVS